MMCRRFNFLTLQKCYIVNQFIVNLSGLDSGINDITSKSFNQSGSQNETDTDQFSISGCSSLASSQSKGDMHKSVENTRNAHTGATGSVTDDKAL